MSIETRVIFNETCPICSREVASYARYSEARALPLRFDGLSESDLTELGLTRDAAARRLHVVKDGTLHAGVPAFLILWEEMPRYRFLARIIGTPGIRQMADLVYEYLLAPLLFAMHKRRDAKAAKA